MQSIRSNDINEDKYLDNRITMNERSDNKQTKSGAKWGVLKQK